MNMQIPTMIANFMSQLGWATMPSCLVKYQSVDARWCKAVHGPPPLPRCAPAWLTQAGRRVTHSTSGPSLSPALPSLTTLTPEATRPL